MKRKPLLVVLALAGCGGGNGFVPTPELLAAAQCAGASLEDLDEVFNEILELLGSIGGVIPPNATYDIATGDYTITLSIGTLAGVVTSPGNLNDGLGAGEQATATWELNGGLAGGAAVIGEGTFTVARASSTNYTVSGSGSTLDGTCRFDMTSVNLALNTASTLGPVGRINFVGTTPDGPLSGSMTFDGSDLARINATFDGTGVSFTIDLNTFQPIF